MYVRIVTLILGFILCFSTNICSGATPSKAEQSLAVDAVSARKALSVVIKLNNIKVEKTAEKKGDELYFSITEYSSLGRTKENRVPIQPVHWLSQNVEKLVNVPLWQGTVQPGEEIKLIISMMEQDSPPWNPDDLIGNAELTLKNEQGSLKKEWKLPIFEETAEVEMLKVEGESVSETTQKFAFKGDRAHYNVTFDVQTQ